MKQTAAYEQMFALAFKNGLRDLLNDMSPRAHMDNKAPRFLALTLLEIARYLASRAVELVRREKVDTMGNEHLDRAVSITFPEQLREHALLKANDDLGMFERGVLTYKKTPEQPKSKIASKRKAAQPPKKKCQSQRKCDVYPQSRQHLQDDGDQRAKHPRSKEQDQNQNQNQKAPSVRLH
ncbi:uncharacterized protein CEXT_679261 [Caerostris extrusa]|uniref:Histone H2A n=1 Tax=Caerostris extrusa TaxID=172846 RepID=A0AAV4NJI6_CAEEX|nr:uncharacterized protein CEXT_679261 [Caerostris extrusa]